jgi:hypothetical protein
LTRRRSEIRALSGPPPREVTLASLQLLLNKIAADGYRKSTVEKVRTHTRACFEYAMDEDLIGKSVDELRAPLSQAAPRERLPGCRTRLRIRPINTISCVGAISPP